MMIFTVTQVCVATSLRNIEKERENSDAPYMRKGQVCVFVRERETFQLVITGWATVGARPCRVVVAFHLPADDGQLYTSNS